MVRSDPKDPPRLNGLFNKDFFNSLLKGLFNTVKLERNVMIKMWRKSCATVILVLILVFGFSCFKTAWAGGPFSNVLIDNFCQGLPDHERDGCKGYLQYRIGRGKSRESALDNCIWGCGEIMNSPSQVENCRKGCRGVNNKDW
jgi:hypothetical protein